MIPPPPTPKARTRQAHAPLAHGGVQPVRKGQQQRLELGDAQRASQPFFAPLWRVVQYVVFNAAAKQRRLLADAAEGGAQEARVEGGDVDTVERDLSSGRFVQPQRQRQQRGFAGAWRYREWGNELGASEHDYG